METFLSEYGLSTDEGVALMCLAEALLRVPDESTIDALIEDKVAPSEWGRHLGRSSSPLVNASTWALMLSGKVLDDTEDRGLVGTLRGLVKRLGEPVIRAGVGQAMKVLGAQFVLGQTLKEALRRAEPGLTYSYDMLGEAAVTDGDARRYLQSYRSAILELGEVATGEGVAERPGISVKLSALHPRFDELQTARVLGELLPRVRELARLAAARRLGFNIDAEEADRLELSLDVFGDLIADPALSGWGGLGLVVQAYGRRAPATVARVVELSRAAGERSMVRLVKGAYWDTEIKRAQVDGVEDFPVWASKPDTDASFIVCARELLAHTPDIYPQFATHNAHTAATVLELADEMGVGREGWEFQRLHGMGEALHEVLREDEGVRVRVYAPVGRHRDLLAYLVRRLLENGANSSFVSQVLDRDVEIEAVVADPLAARERRSNHSAVTLPPDLFLPRRNSRGWDLRERAVRERFLQERDRWKDHGWEARPLLATDAPPSTLREVRNPARPGDVVGHVHEAGADAAPLALQAARAWGAPVAERARVLRAASDALEANAPELFALLAREAGKTALDAIGELREAVDFLRYYAAEAERRGDVMPAGTVVAISPWNFPLAIFLGQVAGALSMGNAVVAKPAEATPLVAMRAVEMLHAAGVPRAALQFLPGEGATVGAALTADARVGGVVFTGSTQTAKRIEASLARHAPAAFLLAETGGINAMVVDSTALPEQAVRDVVASSFQSAGQRCSALRCLYVQDDIADGFLDMLEGAMDELSVGDPWDPTTDVGPVISEAARDDQLAYLAGRNLRHQTRVPETLGGHFVPPTLLEVGSIRAVEREVFGPVLHVARFASGDLDRVVRDINASGYGLTFGLHTRIDDRVEWMSREVRAGNIYVNRNQIGAVVESQPFGGEGLSGTGPKAGGPHYLNRFAAPRRVVVESAPGRVVTLDAAQAALDALPPAPTAPLQTTNQPGPTGESNRLSVFARGAVLCLGPDAASAREQAATAREAQCPALVIAPGVEGEHALDGTLDVSALEHLKGFAAVALWADDATLAQHRQALARRSGPIVALSVGRDLASHLVLERHVCVDTTAAGGNAALLAAAGEEGGTE